MTAQMTPMVIALMAGAAAPALVVLWYCICSLNEMTPASPHGPRFAVVLIAAGVFAELLLIAAGRVPDVVTILLLAGLAVMVFTNCRRGVCPCVRFPLWPDRRREPR